MRVLYNDNDPECCAWLEELMAAGAITPGVVDDRPIQAIRPQELQHYDRVHLFAGIGVWDYALQLAGWPEERPVWTGSCPCQPFSGAGQRTGFEDDRHLWPYMFRLIQECKPHVVFGEQVVSRDALKWFDLVCDNLEWAGYSVGAVVTSAAGVGAPHIRRRLYFVADAYSTRLQAQRTLGQSVNPKARGIGQVCGPVHDGGPSGVAEPSGQRCQGECLPLRGGQGPKDSQASRGGQVGILEDSNGERLQRQGPVQHAHHQIRQAGVVGPTRGAWGGALWIPCSDGRWRPVEPGPGQVAHGVAGDLGLVCLESGETIVWPTMQKPKAARMRLKGYGNAIVAPQAAEFIRAYLEVVHG